MNTKRCPSCKRALPATFDYFSRSSRYKDGWYWCCKKCHSEKRKLTRNTPNGRAKTNAYFRKWIKRDPDKHAAHNIEWERKNPEKAAAIARRTYQKHIDKNRQKGRVHSANHRAKVKGNGGKYTRQDVENMLLRQKGKCYYCSVRLENNYHVEHVVPVSRGGSSDPSNLVVACPTCNRKKGGKLPHEWADGGRLL